MDPNRDVIEPRHEAKPLPFDELTEEQHSAGKQATSLLRGMARETWNPANRQSPVHSYLPVIYKEAHSNRVILLDGARGSGKSALLITLLDAYGRALLEQQVPQKYEAWISPTDRIIPVGLIDLQPLPASTHVLFHLVASLERVVEAMETRNENRAQGTATWHPGGADESKSRRTWRHFARIAASGWEDNLEARKGKLDSEAFAVEVEQGELQRLDVTQSFREFMDALTEDYQAWNHWQSGAPPLFLLAIDDADMNQELSEQLLELVRKLWHPRLAFLLTGDTELFVERLTTPVPPPIPLPPSSVPFRPTTSLDATRQRQLGIERYAKLIPLKHRFLLKELDINQRLVRGPEIARILERLRVPVQKPAPGRQSGTLLDYFGKDSQVLEALPGRLRQLGELAEWLRPLTLEPESPGAARASATALERIWRFAVRMEPNSSRLEPMIRVDSATGRLKIEDEFFVTWEIETRADAVTPHAHLSFLVPVRAKAARHPGRDTSLGTQATAALLLAANFIADTETRMGREPLAPGGMAAPLLAHATLTESIVTGPGLHVWPLPDWTSFLDIELLRKEWELALVLAAPSDPHVAERMAQALLRTVLRVGLGEQLADAMKSEQEDPLSWSALARGLRFAARLLKGELSERRRELSRWALGRSGLLAAPESGLPAEAANALLDALRSSFTDIWPRTRKALRRARRERIALGFQEERNRSVSSETVETFIHGIDQQFLEHQFRHWVEHVEGDTSEQEQAVSHFEKVLSEVRLPSLNRLLGPSPMSKANSLETYLTPLRRKWLSKAPTPMLQHIRDELDSFTRISDAGALALMRFWKAACEAAGAKDVADALQFTNDRLTIAESYKKHLDQKTEQTTIEEEYLLLQLGGQKFSLSVCKVRGASSPFLESKSASKTANRALEAVLRMAYDHQKDLGGTAEHTAPPLYWRGIEVQFQEGARLHPWPVPAWMTLFEWECLEQCWLDALQLEDRAIGSVGEHSDTRIVDALAFWMLSVCQNLQNRRESHLRLQLEITASDWGELIRGNSRPREPYNNTEIRASLYQEWRSRIALMAAPESGLSPTAAANILAVLFSEETSAKDKSAYRVRLPKLRRERMLEAGIPNKDVESLISNIDNANTGHPWVKAFRAQVTSGDASPR